MYYILKPNFKYQDAYDVKIPEVWDHHSLRTGKRIDKDDLPPLYFYVKDISKISHFLVNTWMYLVFSPETRTVIRETAGDVIQYFDAVISEEDTSKRREDYRAANLLRVIPAVDKNNSDTVNDENGNITGIHRLALDEKEIKGNVIFRLSEVPTLVVAHKRLIDELVKNKCTGFSFKGIEDFTL